MLYFVSCFIRVHGGPLSLGFTLRVIAFTNSQWAVQHTCYVVNRHHEFHYLPFVVAVML